MELNLIIPVNLEAGIKAIKQQLRLGAYSGKILSRLVKEFFEKYTPTSIEITGMFILLKGKHFHSDKNYLYREVTLSLLRDAPTDDWLLSQERFSGVYKTIQ